MITTCIFDAYGTLFDVTAAARDAAAAPGAGRLAEAWPALAEDWRQKQVGYSWHRSVTGEHVDFWKVTQDALDYALEANGLSGDPHLRETLLGLYWELPSYPEVPAMLADLKAEGLNTAILSNGSPEMLAGAVDSAGIGGLLDAVLSVEAVGIFKPARQVYDLVGQQFDCQASDVLFVSSNGWDAAAARSYGFETVWVNRAGLPTDRLGHMPDHFAPNLKTIIDIAKAGR